MKITGSFGGSWHRHLQGWRVKQARNQHEAEVASSAYSSTLKNKLRVPRKHQMIFNRLYDPVSQKTELFHRITGEQQIRKLLEEVFVS
jgi:hypothetical protein